MKLMKRKKSQYFFLQDEEKLEFNELQSLVFYYICLKKFVRTGKYLFCNSFNLCKNRKSTFLINSAVENTHQLFLNQQSTLTKSI